MSSSILANARLVLPDGVISGHLVIEDGMIKSVDGGQTSQSAEDLDNDFLVPGLVELHTDHLESHFHPRPGVAWPVTSAIVAHDAQIASSGITTVFDALRAGTFEPTDLSAKNAVILNEAVGAAQQAGLLRAEHFIHLRCELPCEDTATTARQTVAAGDIHLISIMDHTPGARQFTSIDKFAEYYLGKKLLRPDQLDAYVSERKAMQELHASRNKREILALAKELEVTLASHDDATVAHVDEALADGVAIAEFPTTAEAAEAAHKSGLAVLMGAPNVVRGGSHSGNISAMDVALAGQLDVLSSDYVPSSLLAGAFALSAKSDTIALHDAIRLVTLNPAKAAGLIDRGSLTPGKRADLVQVRLVDGLPVVRQVWREGRRVI